MSAMPAHARIAFYTARPDADLDAVLARAKNELVPMMQASPGFRRYTVLRSGPDSIVSITGWDAKEQAEAAAQRLSGWVREVMGPAILSVENRVAEVISLIESSAAPPAYGRVTDGQFQPGKAAEIGEKARTDYLPVLQQQPGFIRHVAFHTGPDQMITFTAFASREALEAAEAATASWREYISSLAAGAPARHVGAVVWSVRQD